MAHFLVFPILQSYFPMASLGTSVRAYRLAFVFSCDQHVRTLPEAPEGKVCCLEEGGLAETAERSCLACF